MNLNAYYMLNETKRTKWTEKFSIYRIDRQKNDVENKTGILYNDTVD